MKEIVKEHPLRPIILQFDFSKPQMEFEKKGLEAHYLMHDLTWNMLQQLREHSHAAEEINAEIAELEYMLLPIEHDLNMLENFLGIRPDAAPPFDEKAQKATVEIDVLAFYDRVNEHNSRLRELHDKTCREIEWSNKHFDMIYEKESWIEESLWKDVHQIYRNYLEAQVDIVTLDRDQEEFRGTLAEVYDYQDMYNDFGTTVFESYTALQERSEKIYHRGKTVNEAFDKM